MKYKNTRMFHAPFIPIRSLQDTHRAVRALDVTESHGAVRELNVPEEEVRHRDDKEEEERVGNKRDTCLEVLPRPHHVLVVGHKLKNLHREQHDEQRIDAAHVTH